MAIRANQRVLGALGVPHLARKKRRDPYRVKSFRARAHPLSSFKCPPLRNLTKALSRLSWKRRDSSRLARCQEMPPWPRAASAA